MASHPTRYYGVSAADGAPLRIGLLLNDALKVPAYEGKIIEDIQQSNFARIECVIATGSPEKSSIKAAVANPILYRLYLRMDARMKPGNDPLALVDGSQLLYGIDTEEAQLQEETFSSDATEKVRSKNLDVLLHFGDESLHGEILKAARYGVWSLQPSDTEFYRGGPPHFWELYDGSMLTGVTLQVLWDGDDGAPVLGKSLFATERTLSVSVNRYGPYWGSTDLVIQKLNQLHRFGWEYVMEKASPSPPYRGKRNIYGEPTNWELLAWLGPKLLRKAMSYPFRKEIVQHWRIGIRVADVQSAEKPTKGAQAAAIHEFDRGSDLSGFRWLDAPHGHFWADPFPFEHEGKCWAFFEDYSYSKDRGVIVCSEISPQGEFGPTQICLDDQIHHFSYPHIFRAGSEIFMVPETSNANVVDLFRCQRFPDQWIRETALLQGKFVDTTIWEHDGLWWMATTTAEPSASAGSLLLFYSTSITGQWTFHPANPISTDIRRNRGGGRVFLDKGRLIRPSQGGAPTYGYNVTFLEITELTKERYAERALKTIGPESWPGLAGIHTYNWTGKVELIDGRAPVPLERVRPKR